MTTTEPLRFVRSEQLDRLAAERFDILIIGGGVTGAYAALDASLRGFRVTRESGFLEPYIKGAADLAEADATLERLGTEDEELAEAFHALQVAEWRFLTEWAQPVLATQMTCTLSCDHRAVDGAVGAELLQAFRSFIEDPLLMLA